MERPVALGVEVRLVREGRVARREGDGAVEPLVQRGALLVQDGVYPLGAAAGVVPDGLGEHLLLGVEVVVGEPRRHAGGARHGPHGHVVVALLGEELHGARQQLAPALPGVHHDSGHVGHLLVTDGTPRLNIGQH